MYRIVETGRWKCNDCERDVHEGAMTGHVNSKQHMNRARERQENDKLQQRWLHGCIPEWIEIRQGYEYCLACDKFASEDHKACTKHFSRVYWWQQQKECRAAMARNAPNDAN